MNHVPPYTPLPFHFFSPPLIDRLYLIGSSFTSEG